MQAKLFEVNMVIQKLLETMGTMGETLENKH